MLSEKTHVLVPQGSSSLPPSASVSSIIREKWTLVLAAPATDLGDAQSVSCAGCRRLPAALGAGAFIKITREH